MLISWAQMRGVLSKLSKDETGLGRWAALGTSFLERLKILQFTGFHRFCMDADSIIHRPYVFFQRHQFAGWIELVAREPVNINNGKSVFFGKA